MASKHRGPKSGGVRHRITEIELIPRARTSDRERLSNAKLFVDDKMLCQLPDIKSGQPLRWKKLIVCDVAPDSKVHLEVSEGHIFKARFKSKAYVVSDVGKQTEVTTEIDALNINATFKLLTPAAAAQYFPEGLDKLEKMKSMPSTLERLGQTRAVFESMLKLGNALSELHPFAKTAFMVCTKVWEGLEQEERCNADVQKLVNGLVGIIEFVDSVKKHARTEQLKGSVEEILTLIEDVSVYVEERELRGGLSFLISGDGDKVEQLLDRFKRLREQFHLGIGAETHKMMCMTERLATLGKLHPVEPSGWDPSRACQDGTRQGIISEITSWAEEREACQNFLWLYGPAGFGKSAIATSVCQRLWKENALAASFFCKRDDPNLRDPLRLINSIAYGLANRCPEYGRAVATAIQENPELCTANMEVRYEELIEKPLRATQDLELPRSLVVLIDALDECGTDTTRRTVWRHLHDMSQLVSWLKVIITSRPQADIQKFIQVPGVRSRNLHFYDASDDIRAYLTRNLNETAQQYNWPEGSIDQLCEKASGVFIWAATANRHISKSIGSTLPRLRDVLEDQESAVSNHLDALYQNVIMGGMKSPEEDQKELFRKCIGVIVAVSTHRPLSVHSLGSLLAPEWDPDTISDIVGSLGAVLYEDENLDGAVRLYHQSFVDFATKQSRSGEFYTQPEERNLELAAGCFKIINQQLRFNICSLETSDLFNSEVPDLADRINSNISDQLNYSCTYWTSHLVHAPRGALLDELESLLKNPRILYLIEALSLLGRVGVVLEGILALQDWLPEDVVELLELLHDFYRFISAFYDAISLSAPHLYVSALALAPSSSRVVQQFRPQFPNVAVATSGGDTDWPSWLRALAHAAGVTSLAVSSDGRLLVSGCAKGSVQICNIQTGIPIGEPLVGHSKDVTSVGFSPDGTRLVTGSQDGAVLLWDVKESALLGSSLVGKSEAVTCVAFSPNGSEIISVTEGRITRLLDLESGEMRAEPLVGHPETVVSASFSRDGSQIASANWDNTVQLWDTRAGSLLGEPLVGHTRAVIFVAYSHDGNTIASASCDETVRLWDTRARMAIGGPLVGHSEPVTSLAFSPDDSRVVSGSFDCTVRLWDVQTGTQVGQTFIGHSQSVTSVSFSSNGSRIVSGSLDQTVRLWAVGSGLAAVGQHLNTPSSAQPQNNEIPPSQGAQPDVPTRLHPAFQGWLSHGSSKLALWLPPHYRHIYGSEASYSMAVRLRLNPSTVSLDFSRFAHGPFWMDAACDAVRQNSA